MIESTKTMYMEEIKRLEEAVRYRKEEIQEMESQMSALHEQVHNMHCGRPDVKNRRNEVLGKTQFLLA